jgi:ACS family hexuronate transporter-like MFS transporter
VIRWVVCALLFFAMVINYVDRQVIGLLKPTLQGEFGWSETDYADIIFVFQLAYAIGLMGGGRLIDRLGTKTGYSLALLVWTAAAMGHAAAPTIGPVVASSLSFVGAGYSTSVAGFMLMRFVLGLGEAAGFPASVKTAAEWFPQRERAFATGIFNSGTNIGALVVPLVVPALTLAFGWRWAFVATGLLGFVWLFAWLAFYSAPESHRSITPAELAHIRQDGPDPAVMLPWRRLVRYRQAWAFAAGKFLTDPVWWLYLFWIPDFFARNYGLDLTTIGPPVVFVYLIADVGSLAGGWISSRLIRAGWHVNRARKTAMLICALAATPVVFAPAVHSLWLAAGIIGLAAAAHQGWSCNLFTLTSDMFPRRLVGSVVGFGGMCGAIGGMYFSKVIGYLLELTGSYVTIFVIAGGMYLFALAVIHLLAPRLAPAEIGGGS